MGLCDICLCGMRLRVMVLFPCWQGKKLVFKLGKAGIGSLSFVVLRCGRGRSLSFRINR